MHLEPKRLVHRAAVAATVGVTVAVVGVSIAQPGKSPAGSIMADDPKAGAPTELGLVNWKRGFGAAVKAAHAAEKPLLVLFSEVPGCATCKGFGEKVMSHPLVVEAAETLFVPVAVYNNIEGDDRRTLESFKEPTWNNPVVRIITADRSPLAERVDGDYTVAGVVRAMEAALKAAHRDVPRFLSLLAEEEVARGDKVETAVFAVHCFWEGEEKIGRLEGVIQTRIGFLDGQEVVEAQFAPAKLPFERLRKQVAALSCATRIYARTDAQAASKAGGATDTLQVKRSSDPVRPDKVQKYHLSRSLYKHVPMTELQASRINAAVAAGEDADRYLSPRQRELHAVIQKSEAAGWPAVVGTSSLVKAWAEAGKVRERLAAEAQLKDRK